jgi:cytochrome c oxidase assembly protein subunit 15
MDRKRIRLLIAAGIALAVVVVVLGAFTRLVHAGLGCPDWPGCYGHLTWPADATEIEMAQQLFPDSPVDLDKTWPEMVHRYFAGALLLLVASLTLLSWRMKIVQDLKKISSVLLVLILIQAAFGAWTVTLKLWPQVVTAHLLGGFATLSLLWVMYLRQGGLPMLALSPSDRRNILTTARVALIAVIVQIALGGWITSNYAALACADFPTCYGQYWPDMNISAGFDVFQSIGPNYLGGLLDSEARVAIHWMHRLGALTVLVLVGLLVLRLWARNFVLAATLSAVLAAQLLLGVLNVVWTLPLVIATLHNACGALLLLIVIAAIFAPAKVPNVSKNT